MNAQEFENQVRATLNMRADRTPEMVRKTVRAMLMMFEGDAPAFDDEEQFIEQISKQVEVKLDLTMADATVIQEPFKEWLNARKPDTDLFYWNRYREYLLNGGFPKLVAGTIDKDTDKIVGLVGNPKAAGEWKRRGLVVGHVQSGKTANYNGVICKSADYGYRVIILLAGVHNNLRSQTQERVEEAFIGVDTDKKDRNLPLKEALTGVGQISEQMRMPFSLTSRVHDFRKDSAKASTFSLDAVNAPVIFVIKKQSSVLKNLVQWFKSLNVTKGGKIRGVPMLLIDDEADNASINTAGDDDNPTKINGQIRELLALFEQNSYVGYTATPFANVFIDPDSEHEMLEDDLFPRDFIVTLDAPKNYVSASRIFSEEGDLKWMLEPVADHHACFPESHKITHQVGVLPESLMECVRRFILGRAVRILRGRGTDHSSMLVNVSRFNSVQTQVTGLITYYLGELLNSVKLHAAMLDGDALKDPGMAALKATWDEMSGDIPETWDQVKTKLADAAGAVVVRTINNKSPDKLDYRKYKDTGLHVIAVGGLSLSRGFTLEGLMDSYFIRNSIMYDTLLQMGRWFGYRDGYLDVCKLYMTSDAIGWYSHISNAIDELREEFRLMEKQGRSPEDFGLKVRTHPDTLIVTARNKMRSGKNFIHSVTLDGRLVETSILHSSDEVLSHNRQALEGLLHELKEHTGSTGSPAGGNLLWQGVSAELVTGFLSRFRNHDNGGMSTQVQPLMKFIQEDPERLGSWDVCLFGLQSGTPVPVGPVQIVPQHRVVREIIDGYQVNGTKMRVASRGDEKVGLTKEQIAKIEQEYKGKNVPDLVYRAERSRPLLMLHVLTLTREDEGSESKVPIKERVAAWGISFPGERGKGRGIQIQYMVNTVWWRGQYPEAEEDTEEELNLVGL